MGRKKSKLDEAGDALEEADIAVAEAVRPYSGTLPIEALSKLSEIGDQPPLRTIAAAVIAAGLAGNYPRLTRAGLRMIAAHSLATGAKNFVKHRVDRTRPHQAVERGGGHKVKRGRNQAKAETSFPSGHSAGALAVACAYAREYPEHRAAALGAAGLVALAQIPRCAHYPTDVGAGLAIGFASEALVDWLSEPVLGALPEPIAGLLADPEEDGSAAEAELEASDGR